MRSAAILFILSLSVTLFASDSIDLSAFKKLESESFQNQTSVGTGTFVHPNEWNPRRMKSAFSQTPVEGALISVGTERTNIAAALNPQINFVVQVDRDQQVVLFNRINTLLLTVADDMKDYQRLRFEASVQVAAFKIKQYTKSEPIPERYLQWFLKTVREQKGFEAFGQKRILTSFAEAHFKDARYTHDRILFQRLQNLARAGRIVSLVGNLGDSSFVQSLNEALELAKIKVSILDISNAWWPQYMKNRDLKTLLSELSASTTAKTQILMTAGGGANAKSNWEYLGISAQGLLSDINKLKADENISTKISSLFIESRNRCGGHF